MACFLVPVGEAVVTTAVSKIIKKKEETKTQESGAQVFTEIETKTPFSKKLKWLTNLLWGGSVLLAFEHLWHGEIVPWFPFLTAAENSQDAAEMLHEMATVGVTMAAFVTAVWVVMLIVSSVMEKRPDAARSGKIAG